MGEGRESIPGSIRVVNRSHLALRKFHLLTGLEWIGSIGFTGIISDGLRCDDGNGSKIIL